MDTLQRLGVPFPIVTTGALGALLILFASMGLFGRKNHFPVEGRVCYISYASYQSVKHR
jgi:3-dehydrosphinganine reductase